MVNLKSGGNLGIAFGLGAAGAARPHTAAGTAALLLESFGLFDCNC